MFPSCTVFLLSCFRFKFLLKLLFHYIAICLIFTIFAGSLRSTVAMRLHLLLIILCCGFSGTLAGRQLGLYWCKFFWSDGGAKSTFTVNFPNVASACPGSSVFAIVCLSLLTVWCSWLAPCRCSTAVAVQIQSSSFCPLPMTRSFNLRC